MLAGESAMREAHSRVGKVDDRAVAQILPETRTVHLHHHSVGRRLRMLLEEASDVLIGSYTGDARSRHELFPLVGRSCRQDSSNFLDEFSIVRVTGGRVREA